MVMKVGLAARQSGDKTNKTRARIERAAVDLFAANGVDAVTTREIAAKAGISEGALYRHFKGKEHLASSLFFSIHHSLSSAIIKIADDEFHIDQQAEMIVSVYCKAAEGDWSAFTYHLLNVHRFLPLEEANKTEGGANPVSVIETIIEDAMERNEIKPGDANLKAAIAVGVVLQAALHKIYGRVEGPLMRHKETLTNAIRAVIHS